MGKRNWIIAGLVLVTLGGWWFWSSRQKNTKETVKEFTVDYGMIRQTISSTGSVQPQNRLVIKPPIGGRIEEILVSEGQQVKVGDILAIMSSTQRAALLDAARLRGTDALKQWEDVYKPTSLLAPIDGEVIVRTVQPGQTVTSSDEVIVLSDRLIVQAQVDETDIGKVKKGQNAVISLDAYPDIKVRGQVNHIYYESKVVNNVTIYAVDILPETVPDVFRSGMSANVEIVQEEKDKILILPREAVKKRKKEAFVMLKKEGYREAVRQEIETGVSDNDNMEIVSGLKPGDKVIVATQRYTPSKQPSGGSPFMPSRGGAGRGR